MIVDFNVQQIEDVVVVGPPALMARDFMSPYVWSEPGGRLGIMLRAVVKPGADKTDTGQIWAGWSTDGRRFDMLDAPVITAGTEEVDAGGVEDPTVHRMRDGSYLVYFTAVCADMTRGELSYAVGPSVDALKKSGVALASTKTMGNTKEATVGRTANGDWRLFYEYAAEEASRVGLATGKGVAGPWTEQLSPFSPRPGSWDDWHLSTGPMLHRDSNMPVMFYNGATHDARWRIGWVAFDADISHVVDRGIEPLITPPPCDDRGATDIAFAASVIEQGDTVWLYYSLEDRRLARARIRQT